MAHVNSGRGPSGWVADAVRSRAAGPVLLGLLFVPILSRAAGGPTHLVSWRITALFLVFAGLLLVIETMEQVRTDRPPSIPLFAIKMALLGFLLWMVTETRTPGFGLSGHPEPRIVMVAGAVILTPVLLSNPRRFGPVQWLAVACFATITAILFYHSVGIPAESFRSRHPLWWGLLVGINLIVVPRYLSIRQFLWGLNRLSAIIVLVTLPIYVIGEYSLFGLQFTFHTTYALPLVGEFRATRSLFVNRNAFGIVVFAGLVAGVDELVRRRKVARGVATLVPGVLLALNVLGVLIADDRLLWLLAPPVVGIYVASELFGRRTIPLAVGAAAAYVVCGLLSLYLGIVAIDDKHRFLLWEAGVRAIQHRTLLLGEGLIAPGAYLSQYHSLGAYSPHNSYISIWLRTGVVGGVAYILLVAGSVVVGALRYRTVDVALLALAFGFAVHQLFEAYTLFQTGATSVMATLTLGFLLFGHVGDETDPDLGGHPQHVGGRTRRPTTGRASSGRTARPRRP